jgi:hypothetical protein
MIRPFRVWVASYFFIGAAARMAGIIADWKKKAPGVPCPSGRLPPAHTAKK